MDVIAADVVEPKSESDLTSSIADGVVNDGPGLAPGSQVLVPETGSPGQLLVPETGSTGQVLVPETGSTGQVLVSETGSPGQVLDSETGSPGQAFTEEPPLGIDDSYEVMWKVDIAIAVPRGN